MRNSPTGAESPRGVCWLGGRGWLFGGRGWRIQVVWLRTAMLKAPRNHLRGQVALWGVHREGPAGGSVSRVKPEPPEKATRWPQHPVGTPSSAGPGAHGGFVEHHPPGGLRRSNPPSPGTGSPEQPGPGAERERREAVGRWCSGARGAVRGGRAAGERLAGRKAKQGGVRRRCFADAPFKPPAACYLLDVFCRRCHTSRGHWGHRVLLSLAASRRRTKGISQTLICPEVQICNRHQEDSVSLSLCLSLSLQSKPLQDLTSTIWESHPFYVPSPFSTMTHHYF